MVSIYAFFLVKILWKLVLEMMCAVHVWASVTVVKISQCAVVIVSLSATESFEVTGLLCAVRFVILGCVLYTHTHTH